MSSKSIPLMNESEIQRFQAKMALAIGDACWLWLAAKDEDGYGIFHLNGANFKAHRIAYFLKHGIDPGKLLVVHTCDNHACVRGDHLAISVQRKLKTTMRKKRSDSTPDDVIAQIKLELEEGRLSQKEIAAKHHLTQSTISKIKRGGYATNAD